MLLSPAVRGWLRLALQVATAIALCVVLQLIATRRNVRVDTTPTQVFRLSDMSVQVAAGFDRPTRITVFYNGQDDALRREMADLLEQFRLVMPDLTYRLVDLDRSPGLAERYQVSSYNTAVLEVGEESARLRAIDEAEITAALLSLSRARERAVCFVTGHGERTPEDTGDRGGYSKLGVALARERFGVETLTTLGTGVPPACTVLVLAGPSKDLLPGEADALLRYVRDGGRALVLVDLDAAPSIVALLGELGIDAPQALIVDEENRFVGADAFMPFVENFRQDIFQNRLTSPAVMSIARPLAIRATLPPGVTLIPVARTGSKSWALNGARQPPDGKVGFRPQEDEPGPFAIGVLATLAPRDGGRPGKVMVVGDSDFATNYYLDLLGNRDLVLSLVALLAEDPALVAVRQKREGAQVLSPIALTDARRTRLLAGTALITPLALLLVGAVVGLRRMRQRGGR